MRTFSTPQGMSVEQVQEIVRLMKIRRNNRAVYRYDNETERKIKIVEGMYFATSIGHFSVSHGNRWPDDEMEYAVIIKVITKGKNSKSKIPKYRK